MNAIRRLPPWALTLISVAPAFALFAFVKAVPGPVVLAGSALAILWCLAIGCLSWRRLDETGRAAHVSAWFWGGASALLLALMSVTLTIFVSGLGDPLVAYIESWSTKHPPAQMGFIFGLLAAALVQVGGYFVTWLIWWGKRR